jgi:hypothetical protein
MNSCVVHPVIEGVDAIYELYRRFPQRDGLFEDLYQRIRENWMRYREPDRWPTPGKNWVLRVAPEVTRHPTQRLEKQLQKTIAICLESEGWGNDVPTCSGLVNSRGRQMNIDLAHRVPDGYEFIELKIKSDTPFEAALQLLRYGAVYMLYRTEPELARRFKSHSMMRAKHVVMEVLAPYPYYSCTDVNLGGVETRLDREVEAFSRRRAAGVKLSFHFRAFPPSFIYHPGMDCDLICEAVRDRISPFAAQ